MIKLSTNNKKNDNCHMLLSFFLCVVCVLIFTGCKDFFHPVESTETPTEFEFNRWLLTQTYLYEEELQNLPEDGDQVQTLYEALTDRYTRYSPPAQSSQTSTAINTSLVEGDVGMEYLNIVTGDEEEHPILISRVYPKSPAGRAGIPRYGRLIYANGIELVGPNAKAIYDSIVDHSATVKVTVYHNSLLKDYELTKENIYAPTVFLDTVYGLTYITITEFKLTTADEKGGTLGELKTYLDSTASETGVRILDLRNNPGGHVSQCVFMADLFIKEGTIATRHYFTFDSDGSRKSVTTKYKASQGDVGEMGKFIVLGNKYSASCAEIFIAALKDNAHIPFAGETTYGKGIGQTTWNTIEGGIAIITSLEFVPPSGISYHKKGVEPDYPCNDTAPRLCAAEAAKKYYGVKINTENNTASSAWNEDKPTLVGNSFGGAIIPESTFVYSKYKFRK